MARPMKDSGVEWIGEIPQEWSIIRVKSGVIKVGSGKTPSGGATTYSDDGILFLRSQNIYDTGLKLDDPTYISQDVDEEMKGTRVQANDVLLNITGASIGRCCIYPKSQGRANVNQHVCIIRVDPCVFLPQFMHYYWMSPLGSLAIKLYQTGGNREGMSAEAIKNTPIIYMPIEEQVKICATIDQQCAAIDAVLDKTRASIEEYKKLKQSVITHAVTKGVRGDRPLKDSGIEWIGEIPAEWSTSRVGLHYDITLGKMLCSDPPSDDYSLEYYYCAANVHFEGISLQDELKQMWFSPIEKELYRVQSGDLLVVEGGAGAGGSAIVEEATNSIYIQNSIMIVRNRTSGGNRYLRYLIEHLVKNGYIDITCNKATIPHFTKDKLGNVPYLVLANDEMNEISDYLDQKCAKIDALIIKKEQFLAELENYKKSLIYEYVTGKREVEM